MEPAQPSYMAPNLTELPKSVFLDFGDQLLPLINLMVEFFPYYGEREYEQTIKSLMTCVTHQNDIDYQLAEFAMQTMETYFRVYVNTPSSNLYNKVSQARLSEVEQLLMIVGRNVYDKISGMSGYVYGVFPYRMAGMQLNCELYLQNVTHLNYDIELNHKPFEFMI